MAIGHREQRNLPASAAFIASRGGHDAASTDRETIMDSLLKGGVLWLMGVPILGVILLKLIGWI